ncbi:FMN-binding glutamate synthase family protein [Halobacteriovorax sp. HLS]|uniref:FMN-binding glutamate synthase family protein n=1 Tax=Halobacteriovorax sp. HLS TaxID=2234000 RepID=UPI000FDAD180|nr:FMN-binding glutamate synthase family protein [Halobacteriovorax sp. HLS]
MRREFIFVSLVVALLEVAAFIYFRSLFYISIVFVAPILFIGYADILQKKQSIRRNYPLFGRMRYWMEELRPKIYQYFIESDIDGTPINRVKRSVVYQRAKNSLATKPYGTQDDVYAEGHEWINHSMYPLGLDEISHEDLRVNIGGKDCKRPYSLSLLNVSAMSFGALSNTAIEALNKGAKLGNFAHNTGEGSISPYHLKHGGDLIWQIGTGYFGCRTEDGNFDSEKFKIRSSREEVKMIEIKLSQGAKPGHGGILPGGKNTEEIAAIRDVTPWTTVESPACHKAFKNNFELLHFIKKLRSLSGGKPIGIKLCFGSRLEFHDLCQQMVETGIKPDFITIDGSEGGTGAAPVEFSDSVGTPLKEGLIKVNNILRGYDLRDDLKILASGKILTGFDIIKAIALGADACYSARGMMLALGCIQALLCNNNKCPTGVATQDPSLAKGLDPDDKGVRVANYHKSTIDSVHELLCASKTPHPSKLNRSHLYRRISPVEVKSYNEIFPVRKVGSLLKNMKNKESA